MLEPKKFEKVNSLRPDITISIVSHGQAELVEKLLLDIDKTAAASGLKEVVITCNIPEQHAFQLQTVPLRIIENNAPKGFGENHNAAFKYCDTDFFAVLNPDIHLNENPWPILRECIQTNHAAGVVGPKVVNTNGEIEDSARPFPTPYKVLKKLFGDRDASLYPINAIPDTPDWIAGMFMLFDAKAFAHVGGFDESYFLYYEDADICARLRNSGLRVLYCKNTEVVHDARRDSHRKLQYLKWHLSSMLRFFWFSKWRFQTLRK